MGERDILSASSLPSWLQWSELAGPDQYQEPGTSAGSSVDRGTQGIGSFSTAFPITSAGNWMRSEAVGIKPILSWDAKVVGDSSAHYNTALVPPLSPRTSV